MNILEIVNMARQDILYDTILPYRWTDNYLLHCLIRAYDELCKETKCIVDGTTTAVTEVPLLSNQSMYALHASVVYIFSARLESDGQPLVKKAESYMDLGFYGWRDTTGTPYMIIPDSASRYFSIYPKYNTTGYILGVSNINFVVAAGPVYTITQAGATFTSHYTTGDEVAVTGTTSNNKTITLTNVADTTLTTSTLLVAEAATSAKLQLVKDTALLRVARKMVTRWVENDLAIATPPTPEIDVDLHYGLLDGIAKFAYLKQDADAYDPNAAQKHRDLFEDFKSQIRFELADLTTEQGVCTPHYGMY